MYGFLRYLAYPIQIYSTILQSIIKIVFLVVFWTIVFPDNIDQIQSLASYFLIADGVGVVTMSTNTMLGRYIRHLIKYGRISAYLIRPVKILPYMYFNVLGEKGIYYLIGLFSIILGFFISKDISLEGIILFFMFLTSAIMIGLSFNLLEGSVSFIFTEVTGFKNALNHITRMLSGAFVPLYFFPETLEKVIMLTPFPWAVFGPANALSSSLNIDTINDFLLSFFWGIFLLIIMLVFWRKVSRSYEATGL